MKSLPVAIFLFLFNELREGGKSGGDGNGAKFDADEGLGAVTMSGMTIFMLLPPL
jgi:hypothetical protein